MIKKIQRIIKRKLKIIFIIIIILFSTYYFFIRDVELDQVKTPEFNIENTEIKEEKEIYISTETEGATIHYEVDDYNDGRSSLNVLSDQFNEDEPIQLEYDTHKKIRAFAIKDGYEDSKIAKQEYIVKRQEEKPEISVFDRENEKRIRLSARFNADIYYTLDGSIPDPESENTKKFEENFNISETKTIKAIADNEVNFPSEVIEKEVEIKEKEEVEEEVEKEIKDIRNLKLENDKDFVKIIDENSLLTIKEDVLKLEELDKQKDYIKKSTKISKEIEKRFTITDSIKNKNELVLVANKNDYPYIIFIDRNDLSLSKEKLSELEDHKIRNINNYEDNYIITGDKYIGDSEKDFSISKINKDLEVVWNTLSYYRGHTPSFETLYDFKVNNNKGIAVGEVLAGVDNDMFISVLDLESGDIITEEKQGSRNIDLFLNIEQNELDDYILAGETNNIYSENQNNQRGYNILLEKRNENLDLIERKILGTEKDYYPVETKYKKEKIYILANNDSNESLIYVLNDKLELLNKKNISGEGISFEIYQDYIYILLDDRLKILKKDILNEGK